MSVLPQNQNKFYFPEIDSLRFFAFLTVFLGHSRLPVTSFFTQKAWYGVEFFFLLSGFLITKALYMEYQKNNSINFRFYFLRRILRIWPLYFSYLILISITSVFVFHLPFSVERSLANFLFIDNFFIAAGWININPGSGHLWTISVEEQYYLVLPFLAFWLFKKNSRGIFIFFVIAFFLLLLGKATAILLKVRYPFIHALPVSADSFLMGVLIGLFYQNQSIPLTKNLLLFSSGIILLIAVILLPNKNITGLHLLLIYPLQAAGFALILISILTGKDSPLNKIFRNKVLIFLGKISFGLYIFHLPVIGKLSGIFNKGSIPVQVLGLLLSFLAVLALSILSYYLLEKPFLNLKKKYQLVPTGN